jgi:hypothetical protein
MLFRRNKEKKNQAMAKYSSGYGASHDSALKTLKAKSRILR